MLIRDIKKQLAGTKIEFEATVKGSSATILSGGNYIQTVTLSDHTGTIPVTFNYGGTRRSLHNGTIVTIKSARCMTTGIHILDFSIPTHSEPEPGSFYEYKPDEAMTKADWEAKDKRMAKCNALNNATALIVCFAEIETKKEGVRALGNVNAEKAKEVACKFLDWIYED